MYVHHYIILYLVVTLVICSVYIHVLLYLLMYTYVGQPLFVASSSTSMIEQCLSNCVMMCVAATCYGFVFIIVQALRAILIMTIA